MNTDDYRQDDFTALRIGRLEKRVEALEQEVAYLKPHTSTVKELKLPEDPRQYGSGRIEL